MNCFGNHLQTRADVGGWKRDASRQRCRSGGGEGIVGIERGLLARVEGLHQDVGVLQRELAVHALAEGLTAGVVLLPAELVVLQRDCASRGDGILGHVIARLPDIAAIERDVHRHLLIGIQFLEQIGGASRPANAGALMRQAGLPLLDLIGVREETERQLLRERVHLRAILHRLDQRADIRHERCVSGFEQTRHLGHP